MKITGKKAKGRILAAPKSEYIRITTQKVKESLFNILGSVEGIKFLDLFAGAGTVGIEALSRGAHPVIFVERNAVHVRAIKRNLNQSGIDQKCGIMATPVEKALLILASKKEEYDIIFADPPYEQGMAADLVKLLGTYNVLKRDGLLVIEHSIREECPESSIFQLTDHRRYGDTALAFFEIRELTAESGS
ncbi:MAG: 16S rRNA (guanine(966)-N(2))-methyltransferase RsmD [Syntrophales bacterium]|jgi:16S rRNA (guanine(966)-N(2))-methyltransferase RsmD|nr:16S rRNA (guanine(966)-N(2))-methyltransferase RsmD [Syntrophales bacterium]MDY0043784.1 16S rRNA (guanine(966)-N(2))-methyltransferase RsmD [Syntrophales bacterium]